MVYLIILAVVVAYMMLTYDASTRLCRWRKDRTRNTPTQRYWTCDYCGAEQLTDGPAPKRCARRI